LNLGLRKNLLSISYITNIHWRLAFEGQQCTDSDCSLANLRTLARAMREGGLYKLLVDPMARVHSNGRLEEPSSFEEAHAWQEAIELSSTLIGNALIASCVGLQDSPLMIRKNMEVVPD
jgi:hypothetical protein